MKIIYILLSKHFLQKDHTGFDDVIIQIIDYLDPTQDNSTLDTLEDLHIKKLVILYPFGLNDQIPISKKIVTQMDLTKLNSVTLL